MNFSLKKLTSNILIKKAIIFSIDFSIPVIFVLITYFFNFYSESFVLALNIELFTLYSFLVFFIILDLYSFRIRILSQSHYLKIIIAIILNFFFLLFSSQIFQSKYFTFELIISFNFFLFSTIISSRIILTSIIHFFTKQKNKNCIIYGAGYHGVYILNRLDNFNVVAFIDDDKAKQKSKINGVSVYSFDSIKDLIAKYNVSNFFISISNLDNLKKSNIIKDLIDYNLEVKILKSYTDQINDLQTSEIFENLDFEEIFSRDIYQNKNYISNFIKNRNILITGAGGSIGSEICLQILEYYPNKIILLDHSEYNLFKIYEQLKNLKNLKNFNLSIIAILNNLQNDEKINKILEDHQVEVLFHVGAYKHVPLLEDNIFEAFENNVVPTINLINSFNNKNSLKKFIYVSSDKAVRPKNIMGATKRYSEKLILSYFNKNNEHNIKSAIVRFGNVFNSNGSVIEIFKKQIENDQPLTITHKEMTRYFMKISEASTLVLEAGSSELDNKIFVLNMGDPINIFDLAKKIFKANILKNNIYKKFKYEEIGLRPGEKLHEELFVNKKNKQDFNDNIFIENDIPQNWETLKLNFDKIRANIKSNNIKEFRRLISEVVEGYN